jgi:hypothetical protein
LHVCTELSELGFLIKPALRDNPGKRKAEEELASAKRQRPSVKLPRVVISEEKRAHGQAQPEFCPPAVGAKAALRAAADAPTAAAVQGAAAAAQSAAGELGDVFYLGNPKLHLTRFAKMNGGQVQWQRTEEGPPHQRLFTTIASIPMGGESPALTACATMRAKKDADAAAALQLCTDLAAAGLLREPVGDRRPRLLSDNVVTIPQAEQAVIDQSLANAARFPITLTLGNVKVETDKDAFRPADVDEGSALVVDCGNSIFQPAAALPAVLPADSVSEVQQWYPDSIKRCPKKCAEVPATTWQSDGVDAAVESFAVDAVKAMRSTQIALVSTSAPDAAVALIVNACRDWVSAGVPGKFNLLHCGRHDAEAVDLAATVASALLEAGVEATVCHHTSAGFVELVAAEEVLFAPRVVCTTYTTALHRARHDIYLASVSHIFVGALGCRRTRHGEFLLTLLRAVARRRPGLRIALLDEAAGAAASLCLQQLAVYFGCPYEGANETQTVKWLPTCCTVALPTHVDTAEPPTIGHGNFHGDWDGGGAVNAAGMPEEASLATLGAAMHSAPSGGGVVRQGR